jgi:hypothetical protein
VLVSARLAALQGRAKPVDVHLVAIGKAAVPALHAAAIAPHLFASVELRDVPDSWSTVVGDPKAQGQIVHAVHGGLTLYDLPDLRSLLPKEP